jgi:hypothetical protein
LFQCFSNKLYIHSFQTKEQQATWYTSCSTIASKLWILILHTCGTSTNLILFRPFGFIAPKILNYLAFQSFDFRRTRWRLFQKRVVHTKFDIYVFITYAITPTPGFVLLCFCLFVFCFFGCIIYRLLHGIFHIPFISPRSWYRPESR